MSIRIALLGAALAVGSMGTAVAADADASAQFGSEAEFVAKFGAEAQKTGDGQYRLQRGTTQYTVNFGAAALRATLAEVEEHLADLAHGTDGSAKAAGDSARLQQRREALWQRLSIESSKGYQDNTNPPFSQCGFNVQLRSIVTPQIAGGIAYATATVSSAGAVPAGGWHAVIGLYATAGASDLNGGLTARYHDYVDHETYNNYTSPSRPAQAEVPNVFYTCLRATSTVEVIAPSGNPWFPNYCGTPIAVVAEHADTGCPMYY